MPVSGTKPEIIIPDLLGIASDLRRKTDLALSRTDCAYLSGLFDGEGCVNFASVKNSRYIRIFITNTELDILKWVQSIFGGDISLLSSRKDGWKQGYCWRLSWTKAIEFLSFIEPWSKIKRRQIEIALAWHSLRPGQGGGCAPGRSRPPDEAVDLLIKELAWWNKRGGSTGPSPVTTILMETFYADIWVHSRYHQAGNAPMEA
jgi:hypothetical protein